MRANTHVKPWLSWLSVGLLVTFCGILAILQYRWIGAVSQAERTTLRERLQESLRRVAQEFDTEIAQGLAALIPNSPDPSSGTDDAYVGRYQQWKKMGRNVHMFRRIAVARPENEGLVLRSLDLNQGVFVRGEWPPDWSSLRERLEERAFGGPPGPGGRGRMFEPRSQEDSAVFEFPHFGHVDRFGGRGGPMAMERGRESEWLIVELDLDYLRHAMAPDLLRWQFGDPARMDYQIEIVRRDSRATPLYESDPNLPPIGSRADASVPFFETPRTQFLMRPGAPRGDGPSAMAGGRRIPMSKGGPPVPEGLRGRWLLLARHRAGSLEAVVTQARWRNLTVTSAVLMLMLAAIVALVQFTRRAQRLAQLQMEFVAGVSHELRTPLSVIRTAAHNLGEGVVTNAEKMQRYGALIEEEAEKLTGIVEQVLRFSSVEAGRPNYVKEPMEVPSLIDKAVKSSEKALHEANCTVERRIEPGLPSIVGDPTALAQALQNLLTNAAKYGAQGGWIGVSASLDGNDKTPAVSIEVTDRGAGIAADELNRIFDPFYRGKKAVGDQIHGTGLGLNLVKRIIEAHGGTVGVRSVLGKGTQFVLRIPAARGGMA